MQETEETPEVLRQLVMQSGKQDTSSSHNDGQPGASGHTVCDSKGKIEVAVSSPYRTAMVSFSEQRILLGLGGSLCSDWLTGESG